MTPKRTCLVLIMSSVLALTAGCKKMTELIGIDDDLKALNDRIKDLTGIVDNQLNAAIEAIPGERWLRNIDDINAPCEVLPNAAEKSKCEDKKNYAKAYLANVARLSGVDPVGEYEVSVWIEATDGKPLGKPEIDIFRTAMANPSDPRSASVVQYFLDHKEFNGHTDMVENELYRPLTSNEIEDAITSAAAEIFRRTVASGITGREISAMGSTGILWSWNAPALPPISGLRCRDQKCADDAYARQVLEFTAQFKKAVMAPYSTTPLLATTLRATEKWDVLESGQHLVVVMPRATWESIKSRSRILAVVHKKGDVKARYQLNRVYVFLPKEFEHAKAVVDPARGDMVWAAHYMVDSFALPRDASDVLLKARRELDALQAQLNGG